MSEVEKINDGKWILLDSGLHQEINGFRQSIRIAVQNTEQDSIGGKTIPVYEKSFIDERNKRVSELKLIIERLKEGLETCQKFDTSKTPEYGEKVRGHVPDIGTRFKTPKEQATETLEWLKTKSSLTNYSEENENA